MTKEEREYYLEMKGETAKILARKKDDAGKAAEYLYLASN